MIDKDKEKFMANFNKDLASIILEYLKKYKEYGGMYNVPYSISVQTDEYIDAVETWEEEFDKMIWSFEEISNGYIHSPQHIKEVEKVSDLALTGESDYLDQTEEDKLSNNKYEDKLSLGLELFSEYIEDLYS